MSLEDLAKKAEEGFEKVVDAAKEKAEEAKDKLAELAGDAKDKAEDAKDKVEEAAEDAKDKAEEIAEDAKDKAEDIKDKLETCATRWGANQEVRPPSPCTRAPDGFTFPRSSDHATGDERSTRAPRARSRGFGGAEGPSPRRRARSGGHRRELRRPPQ